jgi:rhodanese-related sulfurtransferase
MNSYSGIQMMRPPTRAVVVGGGFIGLETAENLRHLGFEVTVVEMLDQVLAPLDPEFARLVGGHLEMHGVQLALGDGVKAFRKADGDMLEVETQSGKVHPADVVIISLGVRPDTGLAKTAGLQIGERGGIRVDDQMRTSDPDIFAVGDAIEVRDVVTGEWCLMALAGPANRQGRIAADVIAGRDSRFRGVQGTAICGLFGGAVAWTGASEKTLERLGITDYEKVYLYPNSHAGYYPGARMVGFKVLYRKSDGRVLGGQALSLDGPAADKRISALAVAIQMGATIDDLAEAELCYAPQFGSAKDPLNFAGMVARDSEQGDMPVAHWNRPFDGFLLDVREPVELAVESVPGAVDIPLGQLRERLAELPRDREIHVICRSGQRAYYATRILLQNGYKARVLSGGMLACCPARSWCPPRRTSGTPSAEPDAVGPAPSCRLRARPDRTAGAAPAGHAQLKNTGPRHHIEPKTDYILHKIRHCSMTMFSMKPKFDLAAFLAVPASARAAKARNAKRGGMQFRPAATPDEAAKPAQAGTPGSADQTKE